MYSTKAFYHIQICVTITATKTHLFHQPDNICSTTLHGHFLLHYPKLLATTNLYPISVILLS